MTKEIALTQGQKTIVDRDDYDRFAHLKWYAVWMKDIQQFYAVHQYVDESGKLKRLYLHREILGLKSGDKRQGDHRNRNSLDNRRDNLRIATVAENMRNSVKHSNNTSGYKGVSFHKFNGKWQAAIRYGGRLHHIGYFYTAERAYRAYCEQAAIHHGEFANTQ